MDKLKSAMERINAGEDIGLVISESINLGPEDISADIQSYQDLLSNEEVKNLAKKGDLHVLAQYLREQNFANLEQTRLRRIAAFLIYQAAFAD